MLKIFPIFGFLLLETLADFHVNSENCLDSFYHPFIDLTEAINQQNVAQIEDTLNFTSRVYYSTNQLISEIANLSWVSTVLSDIYETKQPETNASLCLILSFQITKNRTDIDGRYNTSDILNLRTKTSQENAEEEINSENMSQYLCGVILDFQVEEPKNVKYQRSQAFAEKWDISFTKYTKLILESIFGQNKSVPVGVMYTESQVLGKDRVLLEQEIRQADFAIVNANYFPLKRAPLDFGTFHVHLLEIRERNNEFILSGEVNTTQELKIPLKLMLTWNEYNPSLDSTCSTCLAKDQVYLTSQPLYYEFFHEYIQDQLEFRLNNIDIVSGVQLDTKRTRWLEYTLQNLDYYYTYLYVQKSNTTACQLASMLRKISFNFQNVGVNEDTLSAISHFYDQITNATYLKTQCRNTSYGRLRLPKNFMLFPSSANATYLNETGGAFTNLLQRNLQIGNLTLTTIVFSADDLNSGTIKFARSQIQTNATKIGCQVDITDILSYKTTSAQGIIEFVKQKCHPILSDSTFFVWQIRMDNQTTIQNFEYNFDQSSLKLNMINMLIARQLYKNTNPKQEIMFRVDRETSRNKHSAAECRNFDAYLDSVRLDHLLLKLAALHKIKMMLAMPAFGQSFKSFCPDFI